MNDALYLYPHLDAIDICAGSGIGSAVWRTIGGRTSCYVEMDPYCQSILRNRIRDGVICDAPIWDDIWNFPWDEWVGRVDVFFGGPPCQPFSVAGKHLGEHDPRDLWPAVREGIRTIRPRFVILENVRGLLAASPGRWIESEEGLTWNPPRPAAIGRILGELHTLGYDAEWDVISASAVGSPHRRERVWIVAHANGERQRQSAVEADSVRIGGTTRVGLEVSIGGRHESRVSSKMAHTRGDTSDWPFESRLGGTTDGLALGMDCSRASAWSDGWWGNIDPLLPKVKDRAERLRVIGNGWVPQVAMLPLVRVVERIREENTD